MALERQTVPVPFAAGFDTKTDPKQLPLGKLSILENGVFSSLQRIQKRNGFASVGSGLTAGSVLTAFGSDRLVVLDGASLYDLLPRTNAFSQRGDCPAITMTKTVVDGGSANLTRPDVAYHVASDLVCVVHRNEDTGQAQYTILDGPTKKTVVPATNVPLTAISVFSVYALGNYFVIVASSTVDNALRYATIDVSSGVPGVLSSFTGIDVNAANPTNPIHDGIVVGDLLIIAYQNPASTFGQVKVATLSSALSLSLTLTLAANATPSSWIVQGLGIFNGPGASLTIAYKFRTLAPVYYSTINATGTVALAVNQPSAITLPSATVELCTITGYSSGASAVICAAQMSVSYAFSQDMFFASITAQTPSASQIAGGHLFAKPFLIGSTVYGLLAFPSSTQPTYFIAPLPSEAQLMAGGPGNVGPFVPLARFFEGAAGGMDSSGGFWKPNSTYTRLGVLNMAASQIVRSSSRGVLNVTLNADITALVSLQLAGRQHTAELGRTLFISQSGFMRTYDGHSVVEQGFHLFPEGLTVTAGAGGTTAFPIGTYMYRAVWEWVDAQGQVHQSAPCPAFGATITASGPTRMTVIVRATPFTARESAELVLYRTAANGTIYYRITGSGTPNKAIIVRFPYTTATPTHVYYDDYANNPAGYLETQPPLYTTGGTLDNLPAPACTVMGVYRNRVFAVSELDQLSIWYSKQVIPGTPVEFSDALIQNIDAVGGPALTALAWLDDKLLIFKPDAVFVMSGSGPNDLGQANDFSTPTIVNTNSGCINADSVVIGPNGVSYQSNKGFFTIDRSLNDFYSGLSADAFNADTVVGAALVTKTNQIRWAMGSGKVLMYDYLVRQWGSFPGLAAVSTTLYQNKYAYLLANGTVLAETTGFTDPGPTLIPLKVATGWISFAGLAGYQRVYKMVILGDYKSDHALRVQIAVDYDDTVVQDFTLYPTPVVGSGRPAYEFRVKLKQQKCQAIKVTLTEVAAGNPAEGLALSGLIFEAGVLPNAARLAAAQSVG